MPHDSERVKQSDQSSRGQARTRLARRAVIAAAEPLFVEQGFVATTVAAVSERSDIPPATVYRLFGSKVGILKAWLDMSIAGDDAPIAVADRPPVTDLRAETDPQRLIAGFVDVTASINRRSGSVYRVLTGAAETDATAAGLLEDIQRQRAAGQRRLTQSLVRLDALRAGLTERRATDTVYAMMSPEIYRLLVNDRHWSVPQYRQWLSATLCQQLLA